MDCLTKFNFVGFYLSFILLGVVATGCENKDLVMGVQSNLKNTNQPPVAYNLSKAIRKDTPILIDLSSLVIDQNGDELTYMTIESLPINGGLSLIGMPNVIYHTFLPENPTPSVKRFDGRRLRVQYSPRQGYIGTDKFSFSAYDARGLKSNVAIVSVEIKNTNTSSFNHLPVVFDLDIVTSVKEPIYIDLKSLVYDPDGDSVNIHNYQAVPERDPKTIRKTKHGLIEGSNFFDYLPETLGTEVISFFVSDQRNIQKIVEGKLRIKVVPSEKIQYSQRHRIGGFQSFLNHLELTEKVAVISLHVFIYLSVFLFTFYGIQLLLAYFTIKIHSLILYLFAICLFLLGIYKLLSLVQYSISKIAISVALISIGIAISTIRFRKSSFPEFPTRYSLVYLLLLVNIPILYYHMTAISLPAISLDAYGYLPLYEFFKYEILGWTRGCHAQRILVPLLASLVPVDDPLIAFKVINIGFINLTVLLLYRIWNILGIQRYLVFLAVFWLVFHQYGVVRFYNFWPTSVDVPSYFFLSVLIYILLTKKFSYLFLLSPLAALQHEGFEIFHFALLSYLGGRYFFFPGRTDKNRRTLLIVFASFLLIFISKYITGFINPQGIGGGFFEMVRFHIFQRGLGTANIRAVKVIILNFYCFGGLFLLAVNQLACQDFKTFFQKNNFHTLLFLFFLFNIGITMTGVTMRGVFFIYPALMTLVLILINRKDPILILLCVILSLPMMRIPVDYPFVEDPLFENINHIGLWGIYMVVFYALIAYLNKSAILNQLTETLVNRWKNNRI